MSIDIICNAFYYLHKFANNLKKHLFNEETIMTTVKYEEQSYIGKFITNLSEKPINLISDIYTPYHDTSVNKVFSALIVDYLKDVNIRKILNNANFDPNFFDNLDTKYKEDIKNEKDRHEQALKNAKDTLVKAKKAYDDALILVGADKPSLKATYDAAVTIKNEAIANLDTQNQAEIKRIDDALKAEVEKELNSGEQKKSFIDYVEAKQKEARINKGKNILIGLGHLVQITLRTVEFFAGYAANVLSLAILAAIVGIRKIIHAISIVAYGEINKDLDDLYQTAEKQPGYANRVWVYLTKTFDVVRGVLFSSIKSAKTFFASFDDMINDNAGSTKPILSGNDSISTSNNAISSTISNGTNFANANLAAEESLKI